jgi:hypothetical protein
VCVAVTRAALALLLIGCSSSRTLPDYDADYYGPPPEAGSGADCASGFYGGDPTMQCFARWDCIVEGTLTLICDSDINPPGVACLCYRDGVDPIVVGTPTSCTDIDVITQFARSACGWSYL